MMLITAALLARGWHGDPAEMLMLGHCLSGTKTVWLFKRAFLACKDWFHWDFNTKSSVLLAQPYLTYREEGELLPSFMPAQGHGEMRR